MSGRHKASKALTYCDSNEVLSSLRIDLIYMRQHNYNSIRSELFISNIHLDCIKDRKLWKADGIVNATYTSKPNEKITC